MTKEKLPVKNKTKIIATIILAAFMFFSSNTVQAGYWTENYSANIMHEMLSEAFIMFQKVILQSIKKAANKSIINQMRKMASGTTGGGGVIGDYQDFIFGSTQRNADNYITDFFRVMQTGGVSNETRSELRMVETAIRNELAPTAPEDLFEYRINSPNPREDVFNQAVGGGAEEYLAMQMSGNSHPLDVFFNAQSSIAGQMSIEQESKKSKAVAGGGFDTLVSGNKVVPGSVMKDLVSAAESMPLEMINNASSWQEVIASVAVSSVSSFVKNGIKTVSRPIDNKIRTMERTVNNGVNGVLKDVYQGVNY